ncbi:MAG: AmmeMemoRadiSam system protein B [Candidatus Omnitrophota bacterium]
MVRDPAVAGQFYPGTKEDLARDLKKMIPDIPDKIDAIGAVTPHAGYIYSGAVAGEVYARLKPKQAYIILNPNHTGYGAQFALSPEAWRTPLGEVEIDKELAAALKKKTSLIKEDATAHAFEHSGEVQVPFIQETSPGAKIVPITCYHGDLSELTEVADAIASAISETGKDAIIIASSDMTHFESRKSAKAKDQKAIDRILELDAEGLLRTVSRENISMCGYIPTSIMLMAAKKLGAKKAKLVRYSDSGDATGDTFQVVGYAGIIVY